MAVKTANKRAYLRGEGEERAKYGLSLVVVNSRQGGCPDCAKYIGRVFIDDVYSNGKKSDGDYPLLSTAIAEGLFHPRCKDSTSTYYPELEDLDEPLSDDEIAELDRQRGLEEKQQYAERQAQRFDRRAKYNLDEDNQKFAQARADEWHDRADRLEEKVNKAESNSSENVAKSGESGIIVSEEEKSPRKSKNLDYSVAWSKVQSDEYSAKFKKLSDNEKVYSAIETRAKWALNNRDGLNTEELYAVDLANGTEVARITDQQYPQGVKRTSLFTKNLMRLIVKNTKSYFYIITQTGCLQALAILMLCLIM